MATKKHKRKSIHHKAIYKNLEDLKDALNDTSESVRDKAHEVLNDLIEDLHARQIDSREFVESYTLKNPLQSLGIALAAGIIIGKILL